MFLAFTVDNWDHEEHEQLVDVLAMDQRNGSRKPDLPNGDLVHEQDLKVGSGYGQDEKDMALEPLTQLWD